MTLTLTWAVSSAALSVALVRKAVAVRLIRSSMANPSCGARKHLKCGVVYLTAVSSALDETKRQSKHAQRDFGGACCMKSESPTTGRSLYRRVL